MHVYTLVRLKSNRIGLLTVGLRPLDYSIDSRIKRACIRSIRLETDFAFGACSRSFPGAVSGKYKETILVLWSRSENEKRRRSVSSSTWIHYTLRFCYKSSVCVCARMAMCVDLNERNGREVF